MKERNKEKERKNERERNKEKERKNERERKEKEMIVKD